MVFKRASDRQLKAFAVVKIRELIGSPRRGGGKWLASTLAVALGITKARMSQILGDDPNPGPDVIAALQDLLPMDPTEFNTEAVKWAGSHPDALSLKSEPHVERDDRYPNRAEAVRFARLNKISEDAIARVMALNLKASEDPSADWWYERIKSERDALRLGIEEIGVPLAKDVDEAMRPGTHRLKPEQLKKPAK